MAVTGLLHLSDCHFGRRHHFAAPGTGRAGISLTDSVVKAVGPDRAVTGLIISGDIFDELGEHGRHEVEQARTEIGKLIDAFQIPAKHVGLVPGNHDLDRKREDDAEGRFAQYDEVVASLGIGGGSTSELPGLIVLDSADPPVAIVLLNSCIAESAANSGLGHIGAGQRMEIATQLEASGITPESHVIVAVLHHHLLPIIDQRVIDQDTPSRSASRPPSVTTDAPETLRLLSELGVSLVLHGHQHAPALLEYTDRLLRHRRSLTIVGAGSCGGPGAHGIGRQFWLHRIQRRGSRSTSFEQDSDVDLFTPARSLRTRRSPGDLRGPDDDGCHAYEASLFDVPVAEVREAESDLVLLFLSVTDCRRARAVIKDVARAERESACPRFELAGMYDLLGYWDMLVRLRSTNTAIPSREVVDKLRDELSAVGVHVRENDADMFGKWRNIDVAWELPSLAVYRHRRELGQVELRRTRLSSTEEYDRLRTQRIFLFFTLPDSGSDRLIAQVADAVAAAGVAEIIETVAVSEHEVVLDIFLRCIDSAAINRLNRAIDPVIGPARCQKYTLLSYDYDEPVEDLAVTPDEALA